MREALELVGVIYRCPKTKEDITLTDSSLYSLTGNSWDEEHDSGQIVRLEVYKCSSCGKNHDEVIN